MKIVFTKHAEEKLQEEEPKLLEITKKKIIYVLKRPVIINKTINPHRSIGTLNDELSLVVIWKIENTTIKVVTFYPAERGRYEGKISRGR